MAYEPLLVTAHLQNGFSAADPWSPALDGILAYWQLREELGEEAFALGMSGHRDLVESNLSVATDAEGDQWWYQCSSPLVDIERQQVVHFHKRFDLHHGATYLPDTQRSVLTAGGPYKEYRNPRRLTVARQVQWHIIGDGAEVERLLRRCTVIGMRRLGGDVLRWEITPDGDERIARFLRPLPIAFATQHGMVDGAVMRWGIRPPGRAPEHQTLCLMPEMEAVDVAG